jgi:hypothetical protein
VNIALRKKCFETHKHPGIFVQESIESLNKKPGNYHKANVVVAILLVLVVVLLVTIILLHSLIYCAVTSDYIE